MLGPLDNHARLQLALAYIAMKRGDWARPELERLALAEPANVTYSCWLARLDYDASQYAVRFAGCRMLSPALIVYSRARQPGPLLRSTQPAR